MSSRLLVIFIIAVFSFGCVRQRAVLLLPGAEALSGVAKERAIQGVFSRCDKLHSYRSLARVGITRADEHYRMRYAFIGEWPDKLRIESYPTAGFVAGAVVAVNGDSVVVLNAEDKTAHIRSNPKAAVQDVLQVPLDVEEFLSYLTGRIPCALRSSVDEAYGSALDSGRVQLAINNGEILATVDPSNYNILTLRTLNHFNGQPQLSIDYFDYADLNGEAVPQRLKIEVGRHDLQGEFQLSAMAANVEIRRSLFTPLVPSDYKLAESEG